MNLDDVAKIHAGRRGWFRCMVCTNTASCPQLQDDVWAQAWRQASTRIRQPVCTDDGLCMFFDDQHDRWCELSPRRAWRTHQLLCLPCAEAALGRELTLDDLEICGGNVAHVIMQTRAVAAAVGSAHKPSALDRFLAELERTAPPEPAHHEIPQALLAALAAERDD